jgi:hypothetical protein
MRERYTDFKAVAAALRVLAYVVAGLAGVSAAVALFTQPGFGGKISACVWRLVWSALGFCMLLGASEAVSVLLDIAEQTRRVADALEKRGSHG